MTPLLLLRPQPHRFVQAVAQKNHFWIATIHFSVRDRGPCELRRIQGRLKYTGKLGENIQLTVWDGGGAWQGASADRQQSPGGQ